MPHQDSSISSRSVLKKKKSYQLIVSRNYGLTDDETVPSLRKQATFFERSFDFVIFY